MDYKDPDLTDWPFLSTYAQETFYEGESIKNQPNLFLGDLFFFDVFAL